MSGGWDEETMWHLWLSLVTKPFDKKILRVKAIFSRISPFPLFLVTQPSDKRVFCLQSYTDKVVDMAFENGFDSGVAEMKEKFKPVMDAAHMVAQLDEAQET